MAKCITISYKEKIDNIDSDETVNKMKILAKEKDCGLGEFIIKVFREWDIAKQKEHQEKDG